MNKCTLVIGFSLICWNLHSQPGKSACSEALIGTTKYDLQTNKSCENRIYQFPDGTMGAAWMFSQTTSFDDRGTGYNYYNGTNWGSLPSSRIEPSKTGWPSYAPYNTNGEIFVSHKTGYDGLNVSKRTTKGTGTWTSSEIPNPAGVTLMMWPRIVTNGPNHTYIHLIALTAPVSNGGIIYQGLDGAILYNRSLNGGATWSGWQLLPGMNSSLYVAFKADAYAFADPKGDTLCFVAGDNWNDLFIMKSNNNGQTWTKTIAWHCLYNLWNGGTNVGQFYCPDGSNAVALDKYGKAHIVFGRTRAYGNSSGGRYTVHFTDGLIYWNEDQPQLVQNLDSLTLTLGGHFIGYVQDPGVWTANPSTLPYYYLSLSSMPSITIDQYNRIYVIWSSVTNHKDANNFLLRHIYARGSTCNDLSWCPIVELTSGSAYNTLECVYPSMSPSTTDKIYFIYQSDILGGTYVKGLAGAQGQTTVTTNDIRCQTVLKSAIHCGAIPQVDFTVSTSTPILNQTVTFFDLSVNCPTSWQWSFSPSSVTFVDGTSFVSQNPHVQFTATGVYTVTLSASNAFGTDTLTKTNYITVLPPPPPAADFSADQTNIFTGDFVQFADQSTGNPATWEWTFEGGTPATWTGQSPPPIEYLATGEFDVTLKVSNQYGSTTKIKTNYIIVTPPPPPVADFIGDPTTLNTGSSVQFADLSTYHPVSWSWTFEGGIPSTSTEKTPPPVTYNSPGQFTVSLIVSNATGTDTVTKTGYISVIVPVIPSADFSGAPAILYTGGQVQFTDLSTGSPDSWEWLFDGGTPSTSNLQTPPPITYSATGEYDVTLTVSNVNGNSTKRKIKYITVINAGGPIAKFHGIPTSVDVGNQVQFVDESTGNPVTWAWTFEGGIPGSFDGQSPTAVTYNVSGMYDVTLKVTNQFGTHTSVFQDYIAVSNPFTPLAGFSCDKRNIILGDSVLFTDESTGYPSTYSWTFEGGTPAASSEKSPPRIVYNTSGNYNVSLVVTNPNGSNTMNKDNYISVGGIGIDEEKSGFLLVYPNPAKDKIIIEADGIIPEVIIRDVFGNCLIRKPFNMRSGSVDLSSLVPGIYFLDIKKNSEQINRKFVIR